MVKFLFAMGRGRVAAEPAGTRNDVHGDWFLPCVAGRAQEDSVNDRNSQDQDRERRQRQEQGGQMDQQQNRQGQGQQMNQQAGQQGQQGGMGGGSSEQMGQQEDPSRKYGGIRPDEPIIGRDERSQQGGAGQERSQDQQQESDLQNVEFESDMDDESSRTGEESAGR
jgi:Ca-activated chloride channel family protein